MDLVLIRAITWFCSILQMMLVVTAVLSWFAGTSEFMRGLYQMGTQLTSPLVDPIRKIIYKNGHGQMGLDWAPMIAFLLIRVFQVLVIRLITNVF